MTKKRKISSHTLAAAMMSATQESEFDKEFLCGLLEDLLAKREDGRWVWQQIDVDRNGSIEVKKYETFDQFLKTWSSLKFKDLKQLFSDNISLLALLDEAMQRPKGGGLNQHTDKCLLYNIQKAKAPTGTSHQATLRRLRVYDPELFTRVKKGELSANAAAIEAGWRKRTMQVPADDYDAAIAKINKHYGVETL